MSADLKIDDALRTILQPLEEDEFLQLEASILEDGCHTPLIAWSGTNPPTLLDGHNRKRICEKHGIKFEIQVIDLPDWQAARYWVIRCQLGRRNISPEQASYLRGLRYNAEKTGGHGEKSVHQNDGQNQTAERLRKEFGVGKATIERDGKFAEAVQALVENCRLPDATISLGREKLLKRNETAKVSKEELKTQRLIVRLLLSGDFKNYRQVQDELKRREFERIWIKYKDLSLDDCVDPMTWQPQRMEDLLPRLNDLDAIITDPPYPEEFLSLYGELARLAKVALKPTGILAVMCGQSYLPRIMVDMNKHMKYRWTMAYLTPGGQSVQLWKRNINTFWKPVLLFGDVGSWIGDVIKSKVNDNDKRFHGWGQSESGMANLVESLTSPGAMVCDPFMGGGTTGVVCVGLARRFIGCDIDPSHVENSRKRMQVEKGRMIERTS